MNLKTYILCIEKNKKSDIRRQKYNIRIKDGISKMTHYL